MVYMSDCPYRKNELYHHGIKGQRWGVRRFQNEDGTLTEEGKRRYGTAENFNNKLVYDKTKKEMKKAAKRYAYASPFNMVKRGREYGKSRDAYKIAKERYKNTMKRDTGKDLDSENIKSALKKAAVVGGVTLAAVGAMKLNSLINEGNAEYLSRHRDDIEMVISGIGNEKISQMFGSKITNAIKNIGEKKNGYNVIIPERYRLT